MKSSSALNKDEHYDNLLHYIDQHFGEHEEDLSTYNWIKERIMDGKDFSYSGINLREFLPEHTKQLMKEIDGQSRNTLPCYEE